MFLLGVTLYSSTTLLPLFLQTLMGYTATLAGLVVSPGGIATLLAMPLVGMLLKKYEPRWLVLVGVTLCCAGLLRMSNFSLDIDFATGVRARVTQSLGFAFLFVPINTAAFALIPKARVNYATGLMNLARNVGGSSGIAAATTMLARRAQYHQSVLVSHLTPFDSTYQAALQNAGRALEARGATAADAAVQAQALLYGQVQRQAGMLAFADAFRVFAILFVVVIPLMFLMKRIGPRQGPAVID
jgi:DHA2 family multidrug resistance protein